MDLPVFCMASISRKQSISEWMAKQSVGFGDYYSTRLLKTLINMAKILVIQCHKVPFRWRCNIVQVQE